MKSVLLILAGILIVAASGYLAYTALTDRSPQSSTTTEQQDEDTATEPEDETKPFVFDQPKKSAHYVSNTPEHGAILDQTPGQVTIIFDFDLAPPSDISITRDGHEVSAGEVSISLDKLVLSKAVDPGAGAGLYTVTYNACWPDGSCHDGNFQFGVRP